MQFDVINNLAECKRLWQLLWKGGRLFDDWDYRACLYDPAVHTPHFILGHETGKEVGLLPLWKSAMLNYHEWFGGQFPEHNVLPADDNACIDQLLARAPAATWLPYIECSYQSWIPLAPDEGSFYIDAAGLEHDFEKYYRSFGSKHRNTFARQFAPLRQQAVIARNNLDDVATLINLNKSRFSTTSWFCDDTFSDGFRKILELAAARGELQLLGLRIDGVTEAAEAAIFNNGIYTVLLGGSNRGINNIGKFLIMEHIRNAFALKADEIDYLASDSGWKRTWHFHERKWCEFDTRK